jgi:ubiquinone/menaquinone biosynthesis C-methylase UbiE
VNDALNPQAEQMADESMVRNLSAQADAIWPQEVALVERYGLPAGARVLDAGCGTGEITRRLAERFDGAQVLGVDVLAPHLELARRDAAHLGERVRFEERSVYALGLPSASFDLVVCRHVLQAIPRPADVMRELLRVTRPGGVMHLIVEDYGMLCFESRTRDANAFWARVPSAYGAATGTDVYVGRHAYGHLRRLGLRDVRVDYVVVDPLRAPRETMAGIFAAWRDGYSETLAVHAGMSVADVRAHFDDMLTTLRDPDGYAVWQVPVVSARVP